MKRPQLGTTSVGHLGRTRKSQAASGMKLKAYACELEQKLEARTRELAEARENLAEALEQQTATSEVLTVTSEVLRAISSSHGELEPIFQEMLTNAMRICDAKFGILYEFAKGQFRAISWMGVPPEIGRASCRERV